MTRSIAQLLLDTAELRAGSVITEREIAALKRRWQPWQRGRRADHRLRNPQDECARFMEHGPFRVSQDQSDKGLGYLRALVFRKDGEARHTAWVLDNMTPELIGVLQRFDHFELVEWQWDNNAFGMCFPFPIYRVIGTCGNWFDYIARSWQSGGSQVIT